MLQGLQGKRVLCFYFAAALNVVLVGALLSTYLRLFSGFTPSWPELLPRVLCSVSTEYSVRFTLVDKTTCNYWCDQFQ